MKTRPELCNVFSFLFYISVLLIACLSGCYYVGGAGSELVWVIYKEKKRRGRAKLESSFL